MEKRAERNAYVRVPMLDSSAPGKRAVDRNAVVERLDEINTSLTVIAKRRINPTWVPAAGWVSFRCWDDYHSKSILPYPGGSLAQPGWWDEDSFGFDDLESWCYLEHEKKVLAEAIGLPKRDELDG